MEMRNGITFDFRVGGHVGYMWIMMKTLYHDLSLRKTRSVAKRTNNPQAKKPTTSRKRPPDLQTDRRIGLMKFR